MNRMIWAGGLLLGAAPALAIEGASLGFSTFSPIDAPLSYESFAGPISMSHSNRTMSVRGRMDYGFARVSGSQRLTSLSDGRSERAAIALATWRDEVMVSLSVPDAQIGFYLDVAIPTPKLTVTGYRGAFADMIGAGFVEFQTESRVDGSTLQGIAEVRTTTRDTPLGAPVSRTEITALDGNSEPEPAAGTYEFGFQTSIVGLGSVRSGFDRYLVKASFRDGAYLFTGSAGCANVLTSFRIGDVARGSCGSTIIEWGGLAGIFDRVSGTAIEGATVGFESVSGYDYSQAFTLMAPTASRMPDFAGRMPAVPEPATWSMLIAGFGMVGAAMRNRRIAQAGV